MSFRILHWILGLVVALVLVGCGGGKDGDLATRQLVVTDLEAGTGVVAEAGDHVVVRVEAWVLQDGAKGNTVEIEDDERLDLHLTMGKAMPGLIEGVIGMQEGGKRQLLIGPEKITRRFRPVRLMSEESLWCEVTLESVARVTVETLVEGAGKPVAEGDFLEINYEGWYADAAGKPGERFVSSEEDGRPARLLLGSGMVNEGLDRGLVGMKPGGKRHLVVPPALGYGKQRGGAVRPDATLIYEVELIRVMDVTFEDVRVGEGAPVVPGQRVRFHLAGWLRNEDGSKGEEFQDSRNLSSPYTTIAGQFKVQPGIELGLHGMKRGGLRRVEVPADLAFGDRGWHRGPRTLVPPNSDVIYEIEVLSDAGR